MLLFIVAPTVRPAKPEGRDRREDAEREALTDGSGLIPVRRFARGLRDALRDERVRGLLIFAAAMVFWASVFYRYVEDWSWLDSIYFSVVAISTVGVFVAAVTTIADSILSQGDDEKQPRD